jgi:arsenite-transporting ATPase
MRTAGKTTRPADGRDVRYRFFGGKGGVGKTTCAAAAALGAAETGRRILAISTDPAHSLGDVLATRLGSRPTRVVTRRGLLDAAELAAGRALKRWMASRKASLHAVVAHGTYLDDDDIESLLDLSLPGVDELMGLWELTRLAAGRTYDEVIVDTAPTGHTLRLLGMPSTLRQIASVLDDMQAKHRFLSESLGRGPRRDGSEAVIEEIETEGRAHAEMLRDPRRCTFSWVMLPELMSLDETRDGIEALERGGISVGEIVINRITPHPPTPCALCAERIRAQQAAIRATRSAFPGRPLRLLPELPREPRGMVGLRRVARALRSTSRAPAALARVTRSNRESARSRPVDEPADWLRRLAPTDLRLLLFGGKGGVGKTSCAAAVALALARRRAQQSVLLLSTDPAHSLADALGVPAGDDERRVHGGPPRLAVRELDAERAFHARRERYRAAVDELFRSLSGSAFEVAFDRAVVRDLIDLAPPGLDEILAILSVIDALVPRAGAAPTYDLVVLDTAPTGHALRLLEMPARALDWVRVLMAILLKYRKAIGLGELAADLVEISQGLRQFETLLHDPGRTRAVVVTRPAEVPRVETARFLDGLAALRIAPTAVIVNAVTPPGCAGCRRTAAIEAEVTAAIAADWTARGLDPGAIIEAPLVAPPPHGVPSLARWLTRWTRRTR